MGSYSHLSGWNFSNLMRGKSTKSILDTVNDDAGSHPNDDSNSSFQLQQFMDEHNEKLNALKDEINEQNAKHEEAMQAVQREYDAEIRRLNKESNDEKNVSETDAIDKLTSKYNRELESAHEKIKVLEQKM